MIILVESFVFLKPPAHTLKNHLCKQNMRLFENVDTSLPEIFLEAIF